MRSPHLLKRITRDELPDHGFGQRVISRVGVEPVLFRDGFYDYVMMRADHYNDIHARLEAPAPSVIPIAKTPHGAPMLFCRTLETPGWENVEVVDLETGDVAKGSHGRPYAFYEVDVLKGTGIVYTFPERPGDDELALDHGNHGRTRIYGRFLIREKA